MQVNWRTMVMKFEMADSWVTLQGDPTLSKSPILLKAMILSVEQEAEVYWVQFGELTVESTSKKRIICRLELVIFVFCIGESRLSNFPRYQYYLRLFRYCFCHFL